MTSTPQQRGIQGEQIARAFLENKQYRFITANWRCKAGEIDLIMDHQDTRVIVEVRSRKPTSFGAGYETVSWQKQLKLMRACQSYQQKVGYWGNVRFDVISIIHHQDREPDIEHIEYAFSL